MLAPLRDLSQLVKLIIVLYPALPKGNLSRVPCDSNPRSSLSVLWNQNRIGRVQSRVGFWRGIRCLSAHQHLGP